MAGRRRSWILASTLAALVAATTATQTMAADPSDADRATHAGEDRHRPRLEAADGGVPGHWRRTVTPPERGHDGCEALPEGRLLGHESVGVVYKVGTQVTRCKVGDRVAVCAITPCGRCDHCQRGYSSQCGGMLGGYKFTGQWDGNLAEYFFVNDADYNLVPIPQTLSDEQALYTTDMLTTGLASAENAEIPVGGDGGHFCPGTGGVVCDHRGTARRRWPRDCCGVEAGPAATGQTIRR